MADSKTVSADVEKAMSAINKNYIEGGLEKYMTAGERSSASAKAYAEQIVSSGMTDRTAPGLEETPLAKEIRQTRP